MVKLLAALPPLESKANMQPPSPNRHMKSLPILGTIECSPVKAFQTTCDEQPSRIHLSGFVPIKSDQPKRILDFDLETVAAGFDDPQWVPQKITCCAWSWIGDDEIQSRIATPAGLFGSPGLRRDMLSALLEPIRKADMLVGQNIERFDLPIINAECMRLGLEPIREVLVQDTKRLFRSKGFKKGQDNLCELFETEEKKMSLNWAQWQKAYDEDGWQTIRDRCESDVRANKQLRAKLLAAGYLRPPRRWVGFK